MSKVVFGASTSFHEYTRRLTNSVAVGNVPYNMGEVRVSSIDSVSSLTTICAQDQLIDVFKSVGQVVGFRLVFDRDTGKPRGYGFCEFAGTFNSIRAICKSWIVSDVKLRSSSVIAATLPQKRHVEFFVPSNFTTRAAIKITKQRHRQCATLTM
jgi:hypothetical protein